MSKNITWMHLLFNLMFCLVTLVAAVFLIQYDFREAVFWSVMSGVVSVCNTQLHALHLLDRLAAWHSETTLSSIKCLAFIGSTVTSSALLWYTFYLFYYILPLMVPGDLLDMRYTQAVGWTASTLVSFLSLYWAAARYTCILLLPETQPLLA